MADKLIDIYDADMNLIGQAMKSQAHAEGLWHQCFYCWIVSSDKVWLQLRGENKTFYPNKLHISAAGHIQSGEKPRQGVREIEEEIGLKVNPEDLHKLFVFTSVDNSSGLIDREFAHNYLYVTDKSISDTKLQKEEVAGIFEVDINELIKLFEGKEDKIKISGKDTNNKPIIKTASISDFVPYDDNYYIKVFSTIKRYLENS